MPHPDYRFTASVAVACSGPSAGSVRSGPAGTRRSRDGAKLAHVKADAQHWHEVYVNAESPVDGQRSPVGFHALLIEPSRREVLDAVELASAAVERFSSEPGWNGGQVDFAFAGHGTDEGLLVVRDGEISANDMIDALLSPSRVNSEKRRLSLVLDSCHAGRTLAEVVIDERQRTDFLLIDGFGASMHDEVAWELDLLGHGALTFAMGGRPMGYPDVSGQHARLAKAVREGDEDHVRTALCRHVPNPVTYLTEGEQSSVEVINGWHIESKGGGAIPLLGDLTLARVLDALERARQSELLSDVEL
jgi:hypothetical protein